MATAKKRSSSARARRKPRVVKPRTKTARATKPRAASPRVAKSREGDPPTDLAGYDPTRDAGNCTWDPLAAKHVLEFFAECLKLTSGKCAGQPFILPKWQADFVSTLYGWKRPDGTRRYREALFFVPRKNGKTETGAGLALYSLCCDLEAKPEIYSAANSREQASRIFEPAEIMVRNEPMLSQRLTVVKGQKRIVNGANNGYYTAISAEAATSHGKNPHEVLFDELHTQKNRDLYDGLKSGMGARAQPLFVSLTTAGHDRHSICYEVWQYAKAVRDGVFTDPYFLPLLYQFEDGDDWSDEAVWRRCNPNLGVTISIDFLRTEFERAQSVPAYENTFRNLYLNQWTEQAVRWLSLDKWDACGGDAGDLYGADCYGGLDLSATTDLSALALVFPLPDGRVAAKLHFWVPEESARDREQRDRVPYSQWIRDGWITATPGRSVDYDYIRADLARLRTQHNLITLAIDPWNAQQLAKQLEGDGFKVGFMRQGFGSLSGPSKQLERLVVDQHLVHDNNPVLRWMAGNVAREIDAAENIKPSKSKSTERIDGIVALVMGLGAHSSQAHVGYWEGECGL